VISGFLTEDVFSELSGRSRILSVDVVRCRDVDRVVGVDALAREEVVVVDDMVDAVRLGDVGHAFGRPGHQHRRFAAIAVGDPRKRPLSCEAAADPDDGEEPFPPLIRIPSPVA